MISNNTLLRYQDRLAEIRGKPVFTAYTDKETKITRELKSVPTTNTKSGETDERSATKESYAQLAISRPRTIKETGTIIARVKMGRNT